MAEIKPAYKPPVWLIIVVCLLGVALQNPQHFGLGELTVRLPQLLGLGGFWFYMVESTFFSVVGFVLVVLFFALTERHTLRMIGSWKLWVSFIVIAALSGLILGKKTVEVHGIPVSYEGLSVGVNIIFRASIVMCLVMSVSQRLSPDMMVRAFGKIGMPQAGGAMALGVKVLPQMISRWKSDMKKSRGHGITERIARIIAGADELAEEIGKDVSVWMSPREEAKIFTVTGPKGSGKSTLLKNLIEEAGRKKILCSGIYQPSLFENDERIGYDLEIVSTGERLPLAREGEDTVSRWVFDENAFEKAGKHLSEVEPGGIHVVDEIGRLERQGLGHWPIIARKLPQIGGVWVLSIRSGMVSSVISRLGYESYNALMLPASDDEQAEFIGAVIDAAKDESR